MPLNVTIDDRAVQDALRRLPGRADQAVKKGMQVFGASIVRDFTRDRLSAPDDRVAIPELNGLGIRPASSKGLVRRSGGMARSFITTTKGTKLNNLVTRIGFLSPRIARIARVHELGTIGKGGTLPDIRPRSGPFLAVPVRGLGAALGKSSAVAMLRKAAIPPRLGFRAYVQGALKSGKLTKAIRHEIRKMIERRAA